MEIPLRARWPRLSIFAARKEGLSRRFPAGALAFGQAAGGEAPNIVRN
jgi:hypothetical protein